jgi:superfamily II DNA helicase RecQ
MRCLNKLNLRAKSINSNVTLTERREIRALIEEEDTILKFFYLTPEMATTDFYSQFIHDSLKDGTFSHVVVDEAHCLIDKGYRQSFGKLKDFREAHPEIPFIALTTGSQVSLGFHLFRSY